MKLSEELQRYCYDRIYELANAYNSTLSSGLEYELGFDQVMNMLNVPNIRREAILSASKYHANGSGIPYHKLSPVNQFLITTLPYIWYCLKDKPPPEINTEKVEELINDEEFSQYIHRLGEKISQDVKGGLWRPGTGFLKKIAIVLIIGAILSIGYFLLKKAPFQNIGPMLSYITGGLLFLCWIYFLFIGRKYTRLAGSVHSFTVWQYNILPLLTAVCLFLTRNILFVPLGILFWFAPRLLSGLLPFSVGPASPYILSVIYGYFIGASVGELLSLSFPYWKLVSCIIGIIVIQVVCSLILNFLTGLYDHKT